MKKNNNLKKSMVVSTSLLMGLSTVAPYVTTDVHANEVVNYGVTQTNKITRDQILNAKALTHGPAGDGDDIWASFDGNTKTYTNNSYGPGKNTQEYEIELSKVANLNKIRIHPRPSGPDGVPEECQVYIKVNAADEWQALGEKVVFTKTGYTDWLDDITFEPVQAKFIKLALKSGDTDTVVATTEVEFYEEVTLPDAADKEALNAVIIQALGLKESNYSPASWAVLKDALANAQAVFNSETATLDEVTAAKTALETAIANLVDESLPIRERIEALITKAEQIPDGVYLFSTYYNIQNGIATARVHLANPEYTDEKLVSTYKMLEERVNAANDSNKLTPAGRLVWEFINADEQTSLLEKNYEPKAWKAYTQKLGSTRGIVNNKTYPDYENEILNSLDELKELRAALDEKKYGELNVKLADLILEMNTVEIVQSAVDSYTRDSWRAFKGAIFEANDAVHKANSTFTSITQEEYVRLSQAMTETKAGLTKGTVGQESGRQGWWDNANDGDRDDSSYRGGYLYVVDEKPNAEDPNYVDLTVQWENNGLEPETGHKFAKVSNLDGSYSTSLRKIDKWGKNAKLYVGTDNDHTISNRDYYLDTTERDSFTKVITVPAGSVVNLRLDSGSSSQRTYSLGYYYTHEAITDEIAPKAFIKTVEGNEEISSDVIYGKVSFKFNDDTDLDYYVLNGHKAPTGISGTWGDGNYSNIKGYLQQGENTLTVFDKAGNSTTYTFNLDITAPVWNYNGDINYTVTVPVGTELTFEEFVEMTNVKNNVTDETTLPENIVITDDGWQWDNAVDTANVGKYSINLYAHDEVGNISYNLGITVNVVDETAPKAYFSHDGVVEIENGTVTNADVSLKFSDNYKLGYYVLNGHESPTGLNGTWGDGNYHNIKNYLVEGENVVEVYDSVGNMSTYTFFIDHVAPNIKVNGTVEDEVFTEVSSIALHDTVGLKSVSFNGKVTELDEKYYYIPADKLSTYGELVLGENTIVLTDKAGNEKTYTFVYSDGVDEKSLLEKITNEYISLNCKDHKGLSYNILPETVTLTLTDELDKYLVSIDLEEYIFQYSRDEKIGKDHFISSDKAKYEFVADWNYKTETWSYSAGDWNVWVQCLADADENALLDQLKEEYISLNCKDHKGLSYNVLPETVTLTPTGNNEYKVSIDLEEYIFQYSRDEKIGKDHFISADKASYTFTATWDVNNETWSYSAGDWNVWVQCLADADENALLDQLKEEYISLNCKDHKGLSYNVLPETVTLTPTGNNEYKVSIDLEEYIFQYSRDEKIGKDHFISADKASYTFTATWDVNNETWSYSAGDWNVWVQCLADADENALLDQLKEEYISLNCKDHKGLSYNVLPETVTLTPTGNNEYKVSIDLEEYIFQYSRDEKIGKDHFISADKANYTFTATWDVNNETWSYSAGDWNVWVQCLADADENALLDQLKEKYIILNCKDHKGLSYNVLPETVTLTPTGNNEYKVSIDLEEYIFQYSRDEKIGKDHFISADKASYTFTATWDVNNETWSYSAGDWNVWVQCLEDALPVEPAIPVKDYAKLVVNIRNEKGDLVYSVEYWQEGRKEIDVVYFNTDTVKCLLPENIEFEGHKYVVNKNSYTGDVTLLVLVGYSETIEFTATQTDLPWTDLEPSTPVDPDEGEDIPWTDLEPSTPVDPDEGEDIPWTDLEPSTPVDPDEGEDIPWTDLEPSTPVDPDEGEDIPWTDLEPSTPVDPDEGEDIPWTDLEPSTPVEKEETETPETGDSSNVALLTAAVVFAGTTLAYLAVNKKRKEN